MRWERTVILAGLFSLSLFFLKIFSGVLLQCAAYQSGWGGRRGNVLSVREKAREAENEGRKYRQSGINAKEQWELAATQ